MTDVEYRERVISEISELKNAINLLVEKINSLESKFDKNLELAEGRMKGRTELIEKELDGMSKRVDEKICYNKSAVDKLEASHTALAEECIDKRKSMHEEIDRNHDAILSIQTYQKIMWGIFSAVGVGLIALLADMISRIVSGQ